MDRQVKYTLTEAELPRQWYNIVPDLPSPPPPPLHPGTGQPIGPDDLAPLFPMALIGQEVSGDRHIAIPDEVIDVYRLWRPTPLLRARRLERDLGTPARIYYKYEGGSPAGSHKPNTAVPQAYYNAAEGVTKLTTETGAGQWGSALAFASALFGLELEVWMVRASYDQKPYRKMLMENGHGCQNLQRWRIAATGHDHVWLGFLVIAGPLPDTNALRAVHNGRFHSQPLGQRMFSGNHHIHVVPTAQTVIKHRQQAVGVGRQIDTNDIGFLVDNMVEESRILVRKAVVILLPDMRGEQIIQ